MKEFKEYKNKNNHFIYPIHDVKLNIKNSYDYFIRIKELYKFVMNDYIDNDDKSINNLVLMFGIIKKMKALLNEFHEYLNKNNKITFKEIIKIYFYDLEYFKCLLKDEKEVDLYVSSINDDVQSVKLWKKRN